MKRKTDTNDYSGAFLEKLVQAITPEEQARTDARMKLAARIYKGLQAKQWTQTQLAEALHKQVSVVSKWLSGTHNFTIDTLTDIERVLHIKLLYTDQEEDDNVFNTGSKPVYR